MSFSWVPFYRELAGRVLEFEDKQDELLGFVLQMHTDGFFGKTAKTLDGIDPFTFFSLINVLGLEKRKAACAFLAEKWGLKTHSPADFFGVPEMNPQGCWFFAYEYERKSSDIPFLWKLAKAVFLNSSNPHIEPLFFSCLQIHTVGFIKMTIGLFWFAPQRFLPLDQHMRAMLKRSNIYWNEKAIANGDWETYLSILEQIKIVFGNDFPQISRKAWLEKDINKVASPSLFVEVATEETIPEDSSPNAQRPLNQILYGPPGTGKTYNSIRRAVQTIDGELGANPKARFEELRKAGQIEFVTFHQSFSYEEFIEGLRPVIGDESGQVSYEIRPGILKRIASRAIGAAHQSQSSRPSFEALWIKFLEFLGDSDGVIRAVGKGNGRYQVHVEADKFVRGPNVAGKAARDYSVPVATISKIWSKLKPEEKPGSDTIRLIYGDGVPKGFDCNLGGAVLQKLQDIERETLLLGPHANFQNAPKFVLIIDEINRGNISKILGELITLLEDDKRIGAANELRLTLPTSGETFALPPNLYILGTMNTSDKSLAQLDVALRRRFDFEELAPDIAKHCKLFAAQIPVLEELNNRLEWALDREHRLGHAYFMEVASEDEFNAVFKSKVLPLLLEYFPHDFGTLGNVLGEKGKWFLVEMKRPTGFTGGTKYRWWFESGDEKFSAFGQLKSNYGL